MNRSFVKLLDCILPLLALALLSGCASTPRSGSPAMPEALASLSVEDMVSNGDEAARQGDFERAMFIYMQALSLEESAGTWFRVGRVNSSLGRQQDAWKAYISALRLEPDHTGANEELGLLNMAAGDENAAAQYLQRAIVLDSTRWRSHNALGIMADVDKNYAKAIGHYENALQHLPESPMILSNLGYSHYLAGNWNLAEQHFRMAIALNGNYEPAVANLGLLYARQRRYEKATDTLKQVMPKHRAFNDVGYIAYHNGDYESATELLAEAVRLSPTYYELAYENLEAARVAQRNRDRKPEPRFVTNPPEAANAGDESDSLDSSQRSSEELNSDRSVAAEAAPPAQASAGGTQGIFSIDDPASITKSDDESGLRREYSLAVMAENHDDYEGAMEHYLKALAYDPGSAIILGDISMVHLKMGDTERARLFYERARTAAGDRQPAGSDLEKLDRIRDQLTASNN